MSSNSSSRLVSSLALVLYLGSFSVSQAATPSVDEMWQIIQQQQKLIDQLTSKLEQTQTHLVSTEKKVEENAETVEITADAVEQGIMRRDAGIGGKRTTVGGYGELHYNNLSDDNGNIGGDDDVSRADFHRFVLYFGHEFSDRLRLFSELELEHSLAGDDKPGEVELEQAWIELDLNESHRLRAGLDILPIGLINNTHEPNTFYGVERNRIESEIIPATWWEAGISLNGELAPGWNYDAVIHSGLGMSTDTSGSSALRPRSGRLKVAEADDQDLAFTGRIRYTAIPGLEIGLAGQYQNDVTGTDDGIDISATLFEGHVDWRHESGLGLRALYARWDFDKDPLLDPRTLNADTLLHKFDKNKDGEIDMEEWQAVRDEALRHVMIQHGDMKTAAVVNMLTQTRDKRRPSLLSALPQQFLVRRYQLYSLALTPLFFQRSVRHLDPGYPPRWQLTLSLL